LEICKVISELRMVGDVTGYSQFEDGVLVIYTTLVDPVLEGAHLLETALIIGAQSFMLSTDVVRILLLLLTGKLSMKASIALQTYVSLIYWTS
jgi:hypothetical protein